MRITFLLLIFLISIRSLFGQSSITGLIRNSKNEFIEGASIAISPKKAPFFRYSTISDSHGQFKISFSESADSIELEITNIGYSLFYQRLPNKSLDLNIVLKDEEILLPTIKVERIIPIVKKGDTINYNVKEFASKSDRVIGDVIKKLPGIEVESNGQIKYNGRPISHYYIENLDLLENRYNIANQNISSDLVDQVQILENHQPIKILDSSFIPDNAALNLKLNSRAKNKFFFTSKAGAGLTPFLWTAEILGFNFRKKLQTISGVKVNNTGLNLQSELNTLYTTPLDKLNNLNHAQSLLSLANISTPQIDSKRYLFNNSLLSYLNFITVFKNNAQLKTNISYLKNKNDVTGNSKLTYYLINDQVTIIEDNLQNINANKYTTDLSYTVNKSKIYLKQNIKIDFTNNDDLGTITNPNLVNQELIVKTSQIQNNFQLIFKANKNRVEFNSNSILNNVPQYLTVKPGNIVSIFPSSEPVNTLKQKALTNFFISDNYFSFSKKILRINTDIKAGLQYVNNSITTGLQKINVGQVSNLPDSFKNDLHWKEFKPYFETNASFLKKDFTVEFTSKLENIILNRSQDINFKTNENYFFFNNKLTIKKDLGAYLNLSIAGNIESTINDITQNTPGYILVNYRKASRSSTDIQVNKLYSMNFFLTYRNSIKSLFGYLTGSYSVTNKNLLEIVSFKNQLESRATIPSFNNESTAILISSVSKYLKHFKSTVSLSNNISFSKFTQRQNDQNTFINSKIISSSFNISSRVIDWVFPEYNFAVSHVKLDLNPQINLSSQSSIVQVNQSLKLNFFLTSKITIKFESAYYYSNNKLSHPYSFFDCGVEFKNNKHRVELSGYNLSNIKYFSNLTSLQNTVALTSYKLRPTNIVLYYYFNF